MSRSLRNITRHAVAWSTTLSLLAFSPAPVLGSHPTPTAVGGDWVHFVLDVRWGDVMGEPASFEEALWEGAFAVNGKWGGGPVGFKNWEWGEDNFTYTPEVISWTSKTYGDWDGMRIRVAAEKTAGIAVGVAHPGEAPVPISKTGEEWIQIHEPVVQDLGNGHELVVRVHPLPNPRAMLNVWWGRVHGPRVMTFAPDFSSGVPFDPSMPPPPSGTVVPPQEQEIVVTIAGQDFVFNPALRQVHGTVVIGGEAVAVIITVDKEAMMMKVAIGASVITFQPGGAMSATVTVNGEDISVTVEARTTYEAYTPHAVPEAYQPSPTTEQPPTYEQPPSYYQPNEFSITIKPDGFHPASTISVPPGAKVTWYNMDEREHFVASNNHPTHELLPALSSGNIAPRASYSFVFEQEGKWEYHDHLFPERGGAVAVEAQSASVTMPSSETTSYPIMTSEPQYEPTSIMPCPQGEMPIFEGGRFMRCVASQIMPPTDFVPVDFSGSLGVPAGSLGKVRPMSFEESDGILEKTANGVSWESMIGGNKLTEGNEFCGFLPPADFQSSTQSFSAIKKRVLGTLLATHPVINGDDRHFCPVFHMDRDGLFALMNVATWTAGSKITLNFDSPDVAWSRTFSVEELFRGPFFEPIPVQGMDRGYGVMVMLHEIPDGKMIRGRGHDEVFFMEKGMRRHIPDPFVFEEREFDWDEVKEVEPEELDAIPEDEPLEPPDGLLFHASGDPRVFTFEEGKRRWIENPQVFDDLGMKWDKVRELPPDTLFGYSEGAPFDRPGMRPPDGHFFRFEGRPEVFQFEAGRPQHIPSPEVFESLRLKWEDVPVLAAEHRFSGLKTGNPLEFPDGTLVQEPGGPSIFVVEDGMKRPFNDAEDFTGGGFKWEEVMQIPEHEFERIDEGDPFFAAPEGAVF